MYAVSLIAMLDSLNKDQQISPAMKKLVKKYIKVELRKLKVNEDELK